MTRAAGAAVGAALGAACGTALWEVLTLHSASAAVTVIGPCALLYALVGAVLTGPSASRGPASSAAVSTSAACQAVLPGVPLVSEKPAPVVVPRPRAVGAAP